MQKVRIVNDSGKVLELEVPTSSPLLKAEVGNALQTPDGIFAIKEIRETEEKTGKFLTLFLY